MADKDQFQILSEGVERWNDWRREHSDIRINLNGANLRHAKLSNVDFHFADLIRADLRNADLSNANLWGGNLCRANLSNANLHSAAITQADLRAAKLLHADVNYSSFYETDLRYADLRGIVGCGTRFTDANLMYANLKRAHISYADLDRASLSHTNLHNAELDHSNLSGAYLNHADFSHTDLRSVNFDGTDLSGANLSHANLHWAVFKHTILDNTNFSEARCGGGSFDACNLNSAIGLDLAFHYGPSSIGLDTISYSGGNIPAAFLRGCGLKDWEIELAKLYQRELMPGRATEILYKAHELRTNPAIQFNSCFISYSSKDRSFAENLHQQLQDMGVRCWFAPEVLKIGDKFRQRIDEAIRIHDKLLLILSKDSIASAWVEDEVESALERERREKRLVLFPISIDNDVWISDRAWAASLRRMRHIGDFKDWENSDAYQKAFARLLRDLKIGEL